MIQLLPPAADGEPFSVRSNEGTWSVAWHSPGTAPEGTPYGANAFCVTADDRSGPHVTTGCTPEYMTTETDRHARLRRCPPGPEILRLTLECAPGPILCSGVERVSSCCTGNDCESGAGRCPQSGSAGVAVDVQTVKALLTEQALARLEATSYRFCADPRCDVVYFGGTGSHFGTADLRVPVWQKLPPGSRPVCYCFGESEASIRAEIKLAGQSLAVDRVREHIRAGRCACDVRNPRGTCCLGDVIAAVKRVDSKFAPRPSEDVVRGVADAR
jgi:hypothetical protein